MVDADGDEQRAVPCNGIKKRLFQIGTLCPCNAVWAGYDIASADHAALVRAPP